MSLPPRRRQPLKTYSRKPAPGTTIDRASKRCKLIYHKERSSCTPDLSSELDGISVSDPASTPPMSPPLPPALAPAPIRSGFILATAARTRSRISKRPSRPKATKQQQQLTQMTLDLGQQLRVTCRDCGMSFHPSDPSDVVLHKRFHAKAVGGIEVIGSVLSKIVWRSNGEDEPWFIAQIDRRSPVTERRKAREVLDVVDAELSAAAIPDDVLLGKEERYRVFMLCAQEEKRKIVVVGLLLAERITKAYPACGKGSVAFVEGDARRAVMGISRIWTAAEYRRRGVAKRLLEVAQEHFVYGMTVGKDMIAFSQPTESGGRLARAWFRAEEGGEWLVYDERG